MSPTRCLTVRRCLVPAILTLVLTPAAFGAEPPAGPDKVLATVNGQQITEADVRKAAAPEFEQLDHEYANNVHQLIESKLEEAVQQRMVEAEAKARGVKPEQLLATIAPAPVTAADIDAFYAENKARIPQPKEQVADRIKEFIEMQRQTKAKEAFFATLSAKYNPQILLEPIRVAVDSAGFPARGPADAPVTIVEFSDFQCPFCSQIKPTLDQLLTKYGNKVRLVYRQFPLPMHPNAEKAAEASLCAQDQGKFWELYDAMFGDQQGLAVDALKAKAVKLGLDAAAFGACLDSGKKAMLIQVDQAAGTAAGVNGTPALFVNGRFLNGAQPLEEISKVVDDELRRSGHHG